MLGVMPAIRPKYGLRHLARIDEGRQRTCSCFPLISNHAVARRHSERSVPRLLPLREAPGRAVEESLLDVSHIRRPRFASHSVECGSLLPLFATRARPGVLLVVIVVSTPSAPRTLLPDGRLSPPLSFPDAWRQRGPRFPFVSRHAVAAVIPSEASRALPLREAPGRAVEESLLDANQLRRTRIRLTPCGVRQRLVEPGRFVKESNGGPAI